MNLRQLEAFVAVIETGSFSRAAERLDLGQSTVSTHVAALERQLGLRLFERRGRKVSPSRAGTALLGHAREVLAARRRAESAMLSFRGGDAGTVLVAASTIPATYLMPAWIGAFLVGRPRAGVALRVGDSAQAASLLLEGAVDLAVTGAKPSPAARFKASAVAEDRLVLAVPAGHPLASRREAAPKDLKDLPFLQREPGSGTREAVELAFRRAGLDPARDLRTVCELGSTEAIREGVKAGLGVAILSHWAAAEAERAGTLKTLSVADMPGKRTIWLLEAAGRPLPPLARAFAERMRSGRKSG